MSSEEFRITTSMMLSRFSVPVILLSLALGQSSVAGRLKSQAFLTDFFRGHNEPYIPDPQHPIPGKIHFKVDETAHYFAKYINGSENDFYRRSSCPALNILANRGYINRSGRNITYEEIAQASRKVWNFGDDNVENLSLMLQQNLLTFYRSCWCLSLLSQPTETQLS